MIIFVQLVRWYVAGAYVGPSSRRGKFSGKVSKSVTKCYWNVFWWDCKNAVLYSYVGPSSRLKRCLKVLIGVFSGEFRSTRRKNDTETFLPHPDYPQIIRIVREWRKNVVINTFYALNYKQSSNKQDVPHWRFVVWKFRDNYGKTRKNFFTAQLFIVFILEIHIRGRVVKTIYCKIHKAFAAFLENDHENRSVIVRNK